MNLIEKLSKKLKRFFGKKEEVKKENKPCNCRYCQKQDNQMFGKYSDINENTKNQ